MNYRDPFTYPNPERSALVAARVVDRLHRLKDEVALKLALRHLSRVVDVLRDEEAARQPLTFDDTGRAGSLF